MSQINEDNQQASAQEPPLYAPQSSQTSQAPLHSTRWGWSYHQLGQILRRPGPWRPLVGTLIAAGYYLALNVIFVIVFALIAVSLNGMSALDFLLIEESLDLNDPTFFVISMVSIIMMIPSLYLGFLTIGYRPMGYLLSVAGKLRWRWMGLTVLPAIVVVLAAIVIEIALNLVFEPASDIFANFHFDQSSALMLVLVLVLVPLQASAEEYVFRGGLMQAFGSWIKNPIWPILITSFLFTISHAYDIYGQISVLCFALVAGWLTYRTGGLEAAISLHIANNLIAFCVSAVGLSDSASTETSPMAILSGVVIAGGYLFWVEYLWRQNSSPEASGAAPAPGYFKLPAVPYGHLQAYGNYPPQLPAAPYQPGPYPFVNYPPVQPPQAQQQYPPLYRHPDAGPQNVTPPVETSVTVANDLPQLNLDPVPFNLPGVYQAGPETQQPDSEQN